MTSENENKLRLLDHTSEPIDLIWGAKAIASALKLKTTKQAFEMLERGHIPAQKIGRRWVASRRKLREHFEGASHA